MCVGAVTLESNHVSVRERTEGVTVVGTICWRYSCAQDSFSHRSSSGDLLHIPHVPSVAALTSYFQSLRREGRGMLH